jgi:hypothetical protein
VRRSRRRWCGGRYGGCVERSVGGKKGTRGGIGTSVQIWLVIDTGYGREFFLVEITNILIRKGCFLEILNDLYIVT